MNRLTFMQTFFLHKIEKEGEPVSPNYLAQVYYKTIGEKTFVASRDSFGQTSAAYRTCRKLFQLGLIEELQSKTSGGYTILRYGPKYINKPKPPRRIRGMKNEINNT